jgi:DinB superfamily
MKSTATNLRKVIQKAVPLLKAIKEAEAIIKPAPKKWSKKEILGHLIDSAANNHQRWVRTNQHKQLSFPPYQQDFWVKSQHYQKYKWKEIIALWKAYNNFFAHLIENTHKDALAYTVQVGENQPITLEFMLQDYVAHLKHHLKAILPEAGFDSNFSMEIYKEETKKN